jgi:hypothetical protein
MAPGARRTGCTITRVSVRTYKAGESIEDHCRACKVDRTHTVIVAEPGGRPLRVQCDYCGSQHAFRGGGRTPSLVPPPPARTSGDSPTLAARVTGVGGFGLVSDRECAEERLMVDAGVDGSVALEPLLRRIIREEIGLTPVAPSERWRGGTLVLKPGNPALQEKTWPIETFFHKVVMIRNRLRTLEQQLNALPIDEDAKIKLQGYVTGCYGSLTSFNILFADQADQFKGAGGD